MALALAQMRGDHRPEVVHPAAHGLLRNGDPALGEQILDVTKAECEPQIMGWTVPAPQWKNTGRTGSGAMTITTISDKWERAMKSAYAALSRLDENPPEIISELRALEANCAASYFRSWVGMSIKWRGTSRRPIPDNWHSLGQRSSPHHLAGNRNAAHPVNAILNYAYAALESQIRTKAISEGYDPTIGIMHEGSDGSSKFIFDLMEPERPRVDRAVLDFVKGNVFDHADFVIRTDGVCRLNPEMARMAVAKVSA
jgi:CRISPR-associated endonuclease Cas1